MSETRSPAAAVERERRRTAHQPDARPAVEELGPAAGERRVGEQRGVRQRMVEPGSAERAEDHDVRRRPRRRRPGARAPCRSRPSRPRRARPGCPRRRSSSSAAAGSESPSPTQRSIRTPSPAAWRAPPSAATTSARPSSQPGHAASSSARFGASPSARIAARKPPGRVGRPGGGVAHGRRPARREARDEPLDPRRDGRSDLVGAGLAQLVGVADDRGDPDRPDADRPGHPHVRGRVADVRDLVGRVGQAQQLERAPERRRVGLVNRQVVAEHADGQQRPETRPRQLRLDDHPVAGGDDPQPAAGRVEAGERPGHALERDDVLGPGERRVPELVRLVEPVPRHAEVQIHQAPVRDVVPAVDRLVPGQPERGHHGGVRVLERAERIDQRAVPVEENRPHVGGCYRRGPVRRRQAGCVRNGC